MQLVRVLDRESARWGQLEEGTVHFTQGMGGARDGESAPLDTLTLLPPAGQGKVVCVGRNYLDHIRELGNDTAGLP